MSKDQVYIVVSHTNRLRNQKWEVSEKVEFVNSLRSRHYTTASIIADYINQKVITGKRFNIETYNQLDQYLRTKYPKQFKELDEKYASMVVQQPAVVSDVPNVIIDDFGIARQKTVFDQ